MGREPADGLLLSLDGSHDLAREAVGHFDGAAAPDVLTITAALGQLRDRLTGARPPWLAAVGCPPEREIGYGLISLAVAVLRPRRVVLVDPARGQVRTRPAARHLAVSAGATAGQLASSAAAIGLQRLAATRLLTGPPPRDGRGPELRRLVYVRSLGGYSAAVGGSVTHALEVVRALAEIGVDVDCLTTDHRIARTPALGASSPPWHVVDHAYRFNAVPASFTLAGDLAIVRTALRSARNADAIYQRHARFSLAGAILARLTGRPLFLEYNSPSNFLSADPRVFAAQRQRCEDAALRTAARVVVVSKVARDLVAAQGVDERRILVNPNGVDVEVFASASAGTTREDLGLERDDFVIGFVGSFLQFHGVQVLARAFARLATRRPAARLLLIGAGEGRPEVRDILARAGVLDRARLPGAMPPAKIPAMLAACDVLASPHVPFTDGTPFFGSPTKLFEYMAAGRAIAASRLGQIEEVLDDGRTALLCPPGDDAALAEALERLADDPELRARLGEAARRDARDRHSWRQNAARLAAAYAELREEPAP